MFVVGFKRSNSTPAMVESSGIISLEKMKIGTAQLTSDGDQSRNIEDTETCGLNLHTDDHYTDVTDSSEQTSTNTISVPFSPTARTTSNLGKRRFSTPFSYISCPITLGKLANNSNYIISQNTFEVCSEESSLTQKSVFSNNFNNSRSLPSFP